MGLYHKYRPKTLDEILGQRTVVESLKGYIEDETIPHAILFSGSSGTGKTTLARILKDHLECGEPDFQVLNCSMFRGIDEIRDIQESVRAYPMYGKTRVFFIEEAQGLTPQAQGSILLLLEDPPSHAYFILATTHPEKLLPTIRTRCTTFELANLSDPDLLKLVQRVLDGEKIKLGREIQEKVLKEAGGSARKCLVILERVLKISDDEDKLNTLDSPEAEANAADISRALLDGVRWAEMRSILAKCKEKGESIRYRVLEYMNKIILSGAPKSKRAFQVFQSFRDSFEVAGNCGLTAACWEVLQFKGIK